MSKFSRSPQPDSSSPDILLHVSHLKKQLGSDFQFELNELTIQSRQFCILLGPNAAGKTTFFNLVTGLMPADQGQIMICGFDLYQQRSAALRKIGIVFQESTLDLDLTVEQNLMFHGSLHGLSKSDCQKKLQVETKRLFINDILSRKVRSLNGGHRRRIEIVRAMLHSPQFLLLDEPTSGLDSESCDIILEHVREICIKDGVAALWCTHLLDEAADVDHVYILNQGKMGFQGSFRQLLETGRSSDIKTAYKNLIVSISKNES